MVFSCGIDIGMKNLSMTFVSLDPTDRKLISYKGSLESVLRYETGGESTTLLTLSKKEVSHEAYIKILQAIPEFKETTSTIIEEQLSCNKSNMSRLDGVTYGFLRGTFPQMSVHLHGSTIRKKFITDSLKNEDVSQVVIPRGYPDSKELSFYFVGCLYPEHYEYVHIFPELREKLDDICDSVVYACLARTKGGSTDTKKIAKGTSCAAAPSCAAASSCAAARSS